MFNIIYHLAKRNCILCNKNDERKKSFFVFEYMILRHIPVLGWWGHDLQSSSTANHMLPFLQRVTNPVLGDLILFVSILPVPTL
jgi:hypothetical protein